MKQLALVFFLVLAAVTIVYRRAPMQFLRAESGWYLAQSNADAATHSATLRTFFTSSYGGHYTPLAFAAEFETAKLAGPSRTFWKWRQFVAVALLGAGTFFAVRAVAREIVERRARTFLAGAFTAVAIFQPAMLDLVGWPFMVMQLAWCGLSLLAIYAIARVPLQRQPWTFVALIAAYVSLHFSGLGVVTLAGTTAALLVLRAPLRNRATAALASVATLHIGAMILLLPRNDGHDALPVIGVVQLLLGFIAQFMFSGIRSFVGLAADEPSPFAIQYSWPIGVLLIGGMVALIVRTARSRSLHAAIVCASAVSLLVMLAMIGARMFQENSLHAVATNLAFIVHAARYLVPLHIVLLPAIASAVATAMRNAPRLLRCVALVALIAVPVTQLAFQKTANLYLNPAARVSHYSVWRLIVATARECRAAGLPLPNVPLDAVTREFSDWDPRMFATVSKPNEQVPLIEWKDYLARDRSPYLAKVPALRQLEERLGVEEK